MHEGRYYDSKPVLGVAYRNAFPGEESLRHTEFSDVVGETLRILMALGSGVPHVRQVVEVRRGSGPDAPVVTSYRVAATLSCCVVSGARRGVDLSVTVRTDNLFGEGARSIPVSPIVPELTSSVPPPGFSIHGLTVEDGLVTVDLGGELIAAGGSSLEERTFAQQLAHTALLDDSLTSVRLLVDGVAVTELWGHLDWSEPLRADPSALSPIIIEEPGPATVIFGAGAITVRGQAGVPGGRIVLHLEDGSGTVVAEGQVTATEAAPARGEWTWEVRIPEPGEWVIVARSAGPVAGSVVFETRRLVTLGARG